MFHEKGMRGSRFKAGPGGGEGGAEPPASFEVLTICKQCPKVKMTMSRNVSES